MAVERANAVEKDLGSIAVTLSEGKDKEVKRPAALPQVNADTSHQRVAPRLESPLFATDRVIGRQSDINGESIAEIRKKYGAMTLSLGDVTTVNFEDSKGKKKPKPKDRLLEPIKQDADEKDSDSESESDSGGELSEESSSECSKLEDTDSEDEDVKSHLLAFHRYHSTTPNGSGAVSLAGCCTAQQVADRAATDMKVRGLTTLEKLMKCVVAEKRLHILELGVTVPLWYTEVATAVVGGAQDVHVMACVPQGTALNGEDGSGPQKTGDEQEKEAPPKPAACWLFCCYGNAIHSVLQDMGLMGIVNIGLQNTYHIYSKGKLGMGSAGYVVCASNKATDRTVAIKFLKPRSSTKSVLNEVDMLIRAQGHPNIVRFYGLWALRQEIPQSSRMQVEWRIVTDYYSKGDLYDRVVEGRRMLEQDCLPVMHNILSAIAYIHKKNIFHRDIKPENMLMETSTSIVVTDFGIATTIDKTEDLKMKAGTIGYASPEMLCGVATGFEGDDFGAGVVLYFMLSKSTPFLAPTPAITVKRTRKCRVNLDYECFDHLSPSCTQMILGLTEKEPENRSKAEDLLKKDYMRLCRPVATEPDLPSLGFKIEKKARPGSQADNSGPSPVQSSFNPCTMGNLPALKMMKAEQLGASAEGL
eukprot:TRINITY_DN40378_c0_g1_i1.p1 TRINITY_DN40378_c0_g1~~TRINITY_DN40378_c0_g1_i1.p1  ORF type:complete len:670 (+),score=106.20 TRINITY_DN40378_c0_g1_i1:83-2011(+)